MSSKQSRRDFMRWYRNAPKVVHVAGGWLLYAYAQGVVRPSGTIENWVREQMGMPAQRAFEVTRK